MKKSSITFALSAATAAVSLVACSAGDSPAGSGIQLGGNTNGATAGTTTGAGSTTTGAGVTTTGAGVTTTGASVTTTGASVTTTGSATTTTGPSSTTTGSATGGNNGGNVTSSIFIDASTPVGDASDMCGLQHFDLQRKPGEILLVLDRSASMKDPPDGATTTTSKWDTVIPPLKTVITQNDSIVSWGLKVFPEGAGAECVVGSVTNKIDVMIAPKTATAVNAAIDATTPEGNGTPTGDAINAAVTYLKGIQDDNPKFILLATDGEPSCAGTTKDTTQARTLAETSVTNAHNAGFDTFVIGISTTKSSATTVLNNLAINGGKPRADPNPLSTKYYLANTAAELSSAVSAITVDVTQNCIFNLKTPPPQPDNIRVCIGATGECLGDGGAAKVPRDMTNANGWNYSSTNVVQVYGAWCDQIKASGADQVQIIYGCPKIDVRVN